MTRPIAIHPLSLALGLVIGGACLLSMAQVTTSTPLRVQYIAHPRDMIQIQGGTPYAVPAGKVLHIQSVVWVPQIGQPNPYASGNIAAQILRTNGSQEIVLSFGTGNLPVAAGLTAHAGDQIQGVSATVNSNNVYTSITPNSQVWVYGDLADQ